MSELQKETMAFPKAIWNSKQRDMLHAVIAMCGILIILILFLTKPLYTNSSQAFDLVFAVTLLIPVLAYNLLNLRRCQHSFFCDCCGKYISSHVPWVCGYCGQSHRPAECWEQVTIFQPCKQCEKAPTSYLCHHCNAPFFLDDRQELGHPAVGDQTQKFPFFAIRDDRFKMLLQSVADASIQKVSVGNDIITVFALEPNLSRVRIAWMLKASAAPALRVTGYSNNRQLFSDVAREGLFIDEWESREYLCRMEVHATDPVTKEQLKVDEITYLLHIPKPAAKPIEPFDPVEEKRKKLIALYRDRTATDTTVASLLREYETFLEQLQIPRTERDRLIGRLRVELQSVR